MAVRRTLRTARSIIVGKRSFGVIGTGSDRAGVAGGSAIGEGGVVGASGVAMAELTTACVTTKLNEVAKVASPTKRARMNSLWSPEPRNAMRPVKVPLASAAGNCPICVSEDQVVRSADHSRDTTRPATGLPEASVRRPETVTVSLISDGLLLVVSMTVVPASPGGGGGRGGGGGGGGT